VRLVGQQTWPNSPLVARAAAGATNSPRAFETSTEAKNRLASRFVLNPRWLRGKCLQNPLEFFNFACQLLVPLPDVRGADLG
jgi:hypothetical protein